MEEKIINQVVMNKEEMLAKIIKVVNQPSVKQPPVPGCPYGVDVATALQIALGIGKELGFETVNLDNHIGYVQYGKGEDYVGIFGHLDVVAPTGQWSAPPFEATIKENRIYARGILDNKGPIIACLYGLYAIKQLNLKLQRPIRIVFGCDEESGFDDLEYYLKKEKPPVMGWTPDCKYPAVYAERGRLKVAASVPMVDEKLLFDFLNEYFFNQDEDGRALGIDYSDDEFGTTLMRNYKLEPQFDRLVFTWDVSYPSGVTATNIIANITALAPAINVEIISNYDPVKFGKDTLMIRLLQQAYERITGLDGTPVTTTGGTYAKVMPNIVPFGPSFPGQKGIAHQADEWMNIEDIITNAKIYALAIYYLGGLKNEI